MFERETELGKDFGFRSIFIGFTEGKSICTAIRVVKRKKRCWAQKNDDLNLHNWAITRNAFWNSKDDGFLNVSGCGLIYALC